ncbi:GH25 family lysozyme [Micromonospora sp. NPDC005299]|uniref:GH25 family lysozyme n=1 Tax=Micromonospora sp. NPDC005299 TaxID=3364231 RepID=UPI0036C0740D
MNVNSGVTIGPVGRKILAVAEKYPKANELYVTSGFRNEPGSHHNGLSWNGSATAALDFGAYDDPEPNSKDQADMRDFAKWLLDNFRDDLAELIHTTPFADDNGFYIQNGVWHNFDPGTMAAHLNHVHVAMSGASADRILAKLGISGPPAQPVAPAVAAVTAGPPAHPVAPTVAAGTEVWGWDASNHDWGRGAMDLQAARAAGVSFFTHKVSEGSDWLDSHYKEAMDRARAARIPVVGAYHVLYPGDAKSQAKFFFDQVNAKTPWHKDVPFIWQCDAEKFDNMVREPNRIEIIDFLDELKRLAGGKGYFIAYAPRWLYGDSLKPFPYDLWASDYTGSGAPRPFKEQYQGVPAASWQAFSGRKPTILQFASDAVTGTQPTTDANRFAGSLADLINLTANPDSSQPAPPMPVVAPAMGAVPSGDGLAAELRRLSELLSSGALTAQEFAVAKEKILH